MVTKPQLDARILIVDDDEDNIRLLQRILSDAGYRHIRSTTNPRETFALLVEFKPDLILLDLHMPAMDGYDVLEGLKPWIPEQAYLPVLILSGDTSAEAKERALAAGAMDFLNKPFQAAETKLRIQNLLATRQLHLQLQDQNRELERRVGERTRELEQARLEILDRLARAAEFRDDDTGQHTRRVGMLAGALGRVLGCGPEEVETITRAAMLHDVGKIGVPDSILLKPGKLTDREFSVMREHTLIGARILSGSEVATLKVASAIARTHHERWDGAGYPEGLAGEQIPLVGRIVAVADTLDALVNVRPYKPAWPLEQALEEIRSQAGRQFDPGAVEALEYVISQGGIYVPKA